MREYRPPIRDMRFVLQELLDAEAHYQKHGFEEVDTDTINMILEEGGRFTSEVLTPLSQAGDAVGCILENDEVTTPPGFRDAYQQYVANGWTGMTADPGLGGQGLPSSLGEVMNEMLSSSDVAWGMYPGLSRDAIYTIQAHGTPEQKEVYLKRLIEGTWTGTMCLTESHCGSDLGMLRSRATPQADGSYRITGEKIFISAGEHDMAENIVHLVLARLPDAPGGTKGISLFIVPKYLPDAQGARGARNQLKCGSLEHKMGIKANATCVMVFDEATGFLIGEPNQGLRCMFVMMNAARMGVSMQGLGLAEASFQSAVTYARDRLQMRSLSGPKCPDKPADPIIVHPDVRRMLLTAKSLVEGCRALGYYTATLMDAEHAPVDASEQKEIEMLLGLLTPICKAFITESGFECVNLGLQVFGGHGFIKEWGMEQLVRDSRITTIYEGTTGIQALDLLGRKVLQNQGESLKLFTQQIHLLCKSNTDNAELGPLLEQLAEVNREWGDLTMKIGVSAMKNREEVGSASVDYLMYSGYVALAYFWARMALVAQQKLAAGDDDADFYRAKITTARFYFKRVLPRTRSLAVSMVSGADVLLELDEEHFMFN